MATETVKSMDLPLLDDFDTFEEYYECMQMWELETKVKPENRGPMVAMSIPVDSTKFGDKLRKSVFKTVKPSTLSGNRNGCKAVLDFLKEKLGKCKMADRIETFLKLIEYIRTPGQNIKEFINEFHARYNDCKSLNLNFDDEILTYFMMFNCKLNSIEATLVKSNLNHEENVGNLYNLVKKRMIEMLTNSMGDVVGKQGIPTADVLVAEHHDVLVANGWKPPNKGKYKGYNRVSQNRPDQRNGKMPQQRQQQSDRPQQRQQQPDIGSNPIGTDGKRWQCKACKSTMHLIAKCPHAKSYNQSNGKRQNYESYKKKETYLVEVNHDNEVDEPLLNEYESDSSDPEYVSDQVFCTTDSQKSMFLTEGFGKGSFDTGCTASVAGQVWFDNFVKELPKLRKQQIQGPFKSGRTFMFGNQGVLSSGAMYKLPVKLRGEDHEMEVDIINSDIPLLISRKEMSKLDISIDNKNDKATIRGLPLPVSTTSAGHLIVDLIGKKEVIEMEKVFSVNIMDGDESQQMKSLNKIHKQFGHRPKRAFVNLLKAAGKWDNKFSGMLDHIIDGCQGCIMRKRNPDRPVVAMPMGTEFNEVVTMDLKIWRGKNILYLIDSFTRYTVATVIPKKQPDMVVGAIMEKWVAYFGLMGGILSDNGGEFSSELMREVVSILGVIDHTTSAESPWSNGLCEKNHALADNILQSVIRDYPDMKLDTAIAWACSAKNSLLMVYGYSPNQLVLGKNPRLPNVIDDPPPSWEMKTKSKALMDHLNALQATRQAFLKSESCERLKKALKAKIRRVEEIYENGDIVFYKRERDEIWRGPAKVVFQDGKVIFVRHAGYVVTVHGARLKEAGERLERKIIEQYEEFQKTVIEKNKAVPKAKEVKKKQYEEYTKEIGEVERHEDDGESEDEENEPIQEERQVEEHSSEEERDNEIQGLAEKESEQVNARVENEVREERQENSATPANVRMNAENVRLKLKEKDRVEIKEGDKWQSGVVTRRAGKATGKSKDWWNFKLDNGKEFSADITQSEVRKVTEEEAMYVWAHDEVLACMIPKEQRNTPECVAAKKIELEKLKSFDTYKVVSDIGQTSISTTWVMTQKGDEARARLTARGYEEEDSFPKDSPTMQKHSMRILLSLAALNKWTIETTDIKSAFLQGNKLEREVFVKPPKEAEMKGKLWKLEKCLYGLKDASRQWYKKVQDKLDDLGFKRSKYDQGLFYKLQGGKLIGMIGLHVDDFLTCGGKIFEQTILPDLLKAFEVGKSEAEEFVYTGFRLTQTDKGIKLDQTDFVNNIENPVINADRMKQKNDEMSQDELTWLRRWTGITNWTVRSTRPDLSFDMINHSTKFKGGKVEDLVSAKRTLNNLQRNPAFIMISDVQQAKDCEIWCYSDAAFRNLNDGLDSAGGYVILVVNTKNGLCAPLDWKANKIKRKVASTLAAETISLGTALDSAVSIRDMIVELTGGHINWQVKAIVDNKSCCDAVYSTTSVTERKLRAEIAVIKELIEEKIVSEVKWVRGQYMLADIMTKKGVNSLPLMTVLQQGRISKELMEVCK